MNLSWAVGTRECYGAGLLVFHIFCDERSISEDQCWRTLTNYIYAIKAWHTLHGQTWSVNQEQLKAALDGAMELTPSSLKSHLNLDTPLNAAVYACLTMAFYALCRLGELTSKTIRNFDPDKQVKHADIEFDVKDRHQFCATKIFIPCTKVSAAGESVYWAQQDNQMDHKAALLHHFMINNPQLNGHLFAWRHAKGERPLTRNEFWKWIRNLKVPFDVVKSIGRWSSELFNGYLHKHALILAPYLQESPVLEAFTRYTMPPAH
ncbi:hypothetical protein BDR04DRAFT_1130127 [Suillus decipiens]|nr:hypothetical protein BDR04DRAFT_1130127 [Suillus decipiens]